MGMENWFKKKHKQIEDAFEGDRVSDPVTGAIIQGADSQLEAKRKIREHFENERAA